MIGLPNSVSNRRGSQTRRDARTRRFSLLTSLFSLLFLLSLSFAAVSSPAPAPFSQFNAGNAAYRTRDYAKALETYESLIHDGVSDALLYYNAGCALAQLGRKGRAVAMFERALRLKPRFEAARENLDRIRPQAQQAPPFFLFVPFAALFDALTAEAFFLAAASAYWLFCLAGAAWIWLRGGRLRTAFAALSAASFCVMLFFGAYFFAKESRERRIEAVVVRDKVLSRSGPDEKYLELDLLSEGVKVRRLELPSQGWVKVLLPAGRVGYVPEDAVETI